MLLEASRDTFDKALLFSGDSDMIAGKGDIKGFTELIDTLLSDRNLMVEQSSKNFHKAKDYYAEKLNAERNAFYDLFLKEN